jgi:nucleotide-binding universal stress UspA family protein
MVLGEWQDILSAGNWRNEVPLHAEHLSEWGGRSKKMLQRILVPLDGSTLAEQALPVAARLARATSGTITLLQVTPISFQYGLSNYELYSSRPLVFSQEMLDANLVQARSYLAAVAQSEHLLGIKTETKAIAGAAALTILTIARSQHVDLIVMSSHGYTGFQRWVLGSVAEKVARHSPVPVLILRQGGPIPVGAQPEREGPVRALVPLDGSVLAKAALVPAAEVVSALAAPGKGVLHLTRVVVSPQAEQLDARQREAVMHKAKEYLSTTVQHIHEGFVAPPIGTLPLVLTWSVALDDDVASGILRVAESGEDAEGAAASARCDLIAMATHGDTGWQHLALGSVTERVLHATKLPLLIVPSRKMLATGNQAEYSSLHQSTGMSTQL